MFPKGFVVGCALLATLLILSTSAFAATACVWRVTNAPAPFYLVGTIHALSGKDYPLPKPYTEAIHNSQQFYFEISPHDPDDKFGKLFEAAAVYPKGGDIRKHIHPQTWAFWRRDSGNPMLSGSGIFGEHYIEGPQELRPWAIAYMVWGIRGYSNISGQYGVDNHISYEARRAGKACGGLESYEAHVDVLRGMADIDAELILLDALVRGDQRRDDYNAMRAALETWRYRGDAGGRQSPAQTEPGSGNAPSGLSQSALDSEDRGLNQKRSSHLNRRRNGTFLRYK
jgi:uncharacterized protein YbaP (TraB family)